MSHSSLSRVRALCLTLPDAHEVVAWGEPTFRVRNKLFAMYASAQTHHGGGRDAVWVNAAPENQALLVRAAPATYFVPPYVGARGWIGVWLDSVPDWDELAGLLRDAHARAAPKRRPTAGAAGAAGAAATAPPPSARPGRRGRRTSPPAG